MVDKVAGYFFAIFFLIVTLPTILVIIGIYRLRTYNKKCFDVKLAIRARKAIIEKRKHLLKIHREETQYSLSERAKNVGINVLNNVQKQALTIVQNRPQEAKDEVDEKNDEEKNDCEFNEENVKKGLVNEEEGDTSEIVRYLSQYVRTALGNNMAYWGIDDMLLKNGILVGECIELPPGLFEDFVYSTCNNVNPLPLIFGDRQNPEPIPARFISYCLAQAVALYLYIYIDSGLGRALMDILLSPFVVAIEATLNYLLVCPCIRDEGEVSKTERLQKTRAQKCVMFMKWILRLTGGILAFPLLTFLILILVKAAQDLANGAAKDKKLGTFIYDGIIIPFLIRIFLQSINYWWFIFPVHINILGINVFQVNFWTEGRNKEQEIIAISNLTYHERREYEAKKIRKQFGDFDFCFVTCYCVRYSGFDTDIYYNCDLCLPYCYISRWYERMVKWYWEEPVVSSEHLRLLDSKSSIPFATVDADEEQGQDYNDHYDHVDGHNGSDERQVLASETIPVEYRAANDDENERKEAIEVKEVYVIEDNEEGDEERDIESEAK